ncbi:MAG: hypothetical protein GEU28_07960 [Dehalococcoidia bacterium]|nr:hypothetical protein [Dehalococcoidia bacterium]
MEFRRSGTVNADVDAVWRMLSDVERVARCAPGAQITRKIDDDHYEGVMSVRLGPINSSFGGQLAIAERHDDTHSAVLNASGIDSSTKSTARATFRAQLSEAGPSLTQLDSVVEVQLSGRLARFGKGIFESVSVQLMEQFLACLEAQIRAPAAEVAALDEPPSLGVLPLAYGTARMGLASAVDRLKDALPGVGERKSDGDKRRQD